MAFPASVATRNRPRYRDVWDMPWLRANGTEIRTDLVQAKMRDHRTPPSWLEDAAGTAGDIVRSPAFSAELRHFGRRDAARKTLDGSRHMEFLARRKQNVYWRKACATWGRNPDPERAWPPLAGRPCHDRDVRRAGLPTRRCSAHAFTPCRRQRMWLPNCGSPDRVSKLAFADVSRQLLADHATSTSVRAKSSPLNSSGSPVTAASA